MVLDAVMEHIDDEKNLLRTTVVCYDGARTKRIAVGRGLFNRYPPKLGVMENVKPLARHLWATPSLNFLARYMFDKYKVGLIYLNRRKHHRKTKSLPSFSIDDERKKYDLECESHATTNDGQLYNGLTKEEYIHVTEKEPVFGDKVLGIRVLAMSHGQCITAIPFKDSFMGNFVTSAMHGGVMASLMDQTAGMCARSVVKDEQKRVSTVNFSIDYLAPAKCFEHIICEARVVSDNAQEEVEDGRELVFVEATCWNESKTIVTGVGKLTFNVYRRQT